MVPSLIWLEGNLVMEALQLITVRSRVWSEESGPYGCALQGCVSFLAPSVALHFLVAKRLLRGKHFHFYPVPCYLALEPPDYENKTFKICQPKQTFPFWCFGYFVPAIKKVTKTDIGTRGGAVAETAWSCDSEAFVTGSREELRNVRWCWLEKQLRCCKLSLMGEWSELKWTECW